MYAQLKIQNVSVRARAIRASRHLGTVFLTTTITRPTMKEGLYWFTGNGKKLLVIQDEPRRKTGCLWNAMLRIILAETTR